MVIGAANLNTISSEIPSKMRSVKSIAYVWFLGQLAIDRETDEEKLKKKLSSPLMFTPQFPVASVSCGVSLAAFLTVNGQVFTWNLKQTSDNQSMECPKLLHASNERKIKNICCGDHHLCCLCENNNVLTMGCFHHGQLGAGTFDSVDEGMTQQSGKEASFCYCGVSLEPSKQNLIKDVFLLTFNTTIASIACGPSQTFVITSKGVVWGMGRGISGWEAYSKDSQEKDVAEVIYTSPKLIQLFSTSQGVPLRQIACGEGFFLALTQNGDVISWGRNHTGCTGHGLKSHYEWPQKVRFRPLLEKQQPHKSVDEKDRTNDTFPRISFIFAGTYSGAVSSTGSLFLWGCMDWLIPHQVSKKDTLDNKSFLLEADKAVVCLLSKTMVSLEPHGQLCVTTLKLPFRSISVCENSRQGFNFLSCSSKLCVALGPSSDSIPCGVFVEKTKPKANSITVDVITDSPPSFGEMSEEEEVPPCQGTLGVDDQPNNQLHYDDRMSSSTSCSTGLDTEHPFFQDTARKAFQLKNSSCHFCVEKSQQIDQLQEKLDRLEREFTHVLNQYQEDLLSLSETFNKRKETRERFDKELLQILQQGSQDESPGWIENIQNAIDQFTLNTKDPILVHGCTPMLMLIERFLQKQKYLEQHIRACEKRMSEVAMSETDSLEKLNVITQKLAEKDKAFTILEEQKRQLEGDHENDLQKIQMLTGSLEKMRVLKLEQDDQLFQIQTNLQKTCSELDIAEHQNRLLKSDLGRLSAQCEQDHLLQLKLDSTEASQSRLKLRLSEAESQLNLLKSQVQHLEEEKTKANLALVGKDYDLQTLQLEKENLSSINQRLLQEKKSSDDEVVKLKDFLQHFQAEKESEKLNVAYLEESNLKIGRLEDELSNKRRKEEETLREIQQLQQEKKDLQREIDTVRMEHHQILTETREKHNLSEQHLEKKWTIEMKKRQRLEEELNRLRHELHLSNEQINRQQQDNAALISSLHSRLLIFTQETSVGCNSSPNKIVHDTDALEMNETTSSLHILQTLDKTMEFIHQERLTRQEELDALSSRLERLQQDYETQLDSANEPCLGCQQLKMQIKALENEVLETHHFLAQVESNLSYPTSRDDTTAMIMKENENQSGCQTVSPKDMYITSACKREETKKRIDEENLQRHFDSNHQALDIHSSPKFDLSDNTDHKCRNVDAIQTCDEIHHVSLQENFPENLNKVLNTSQINSSHDSTSGSGSGSPENLSTSAKMNNVSKKTNDSLPFPGRFIYSLPKQLRSVKFPLSHYTKHSATPYQFPSVKTVTSWSSSS